MTMTNKQYSAKLVAVKTSATAIKRNVQSLIEDGMVHAEENGNTHRLSAVMQVCIATKALPTTDIKEYIKDHANNLKFGKNKDGNLVFSKERQGEPFGFTKPELPWYEFTAKSQAKPDMDVQARVKSLLTSLDTAMTKGTIKQGQEETAGELREALAKFTA